MGSESALGSAQESDAGAAPGLGSDVDAVATDADAGPGSDVDAGPDVAQDADAGPVLDAEA